MDVRFFDNSLKELSDELDLSAQRSFLYGDGHFTTAKVVDGHIELLSLHVERLKSANRQLSFNPILWNKLEALMEHAASSIPLGVIKVQISRGAAQRGYGQTLRTQPLVILSVSELPSDWLLSQQSPLSLSVAETKLGIQPLLAGAKHCNRLEQVLIARELELQNIEDALVLDINDHIIETNKANVFWLQENQWFTPSLQNSGVNGVMRQHILGSIDAEIVQRTPQQIIENVEAMFICNSLIGLRPVKQLMDKPLSLNPVEQLRAKL